MNDSPSHPKTIGRFAPSPTGALHFGSIVTALASFCLARQAGGEWLVRMDDLDQPRVVTGSSDIILRQLELCGLFWDRQVLYQSSRLERYREIIAQLQHARLIYPCGCSRKEILASAPHFGEEGPVYPGTCRHTSCVHPAPAWRLKCRSEVISFHDRIQGDYQQQLAKQVGDFVLQRGDGVFSYQLAVVIDDHDSAVTQIVRGRDLLSSTPRQLFLQQLLGFTRPEYAHLPLALTNHGEKISKRHHQLNSLDLRSCASLLYRALLFLGQQPPAALADENAQTIVEWACCHFSLPRIPQHDQSISL